MKNYKLSELKEICQQYCVKGETQCGSVDCPIQYECFQLATLYYADLQLDEDDD